MPTRKSTKCLACEGSGKNMGFPGGGSGKEPTCQCRRHKKWCGFDPWMGKIPWRRAWQPTPVFLPGESHGQRRLAGYSPGGHRELDTTEQPEHARMHTGKSIQVIAFPMSPSSEFLPWDPSCASWIKSNCLFLVSNKWHGEAIERKHGRRGRCRVNKTICCLCGTYVCPRALSVLQYVSAKKLWVWQCGNKTVQRAFYFLTV